MQVSLPFRALFDVADDLETLITRVPISIRGSTIPKDRVILHETIEGIRISRALEGSVFIGEEDPEGKFVLQAIHVVV